MIKFFLLIIFTFSICFPNNNDSLLVSKNSEDLWQLSLYPSFNMSSMGQLQNDKPLKALILSGMKFHWLNEFKVAQDAMKLSERSRAFWWFLFLYFYTIIDASIDAEMESFPLENEKLKESE